MKEYCVACNMKAVSSSLSGRLFLRHKHGRICWFESHHKTVSLTPLWLKYKKENRQSII